MLCLRVPSIPQPLTNPQSLRMPSFEQMQEKSDSPGGSCAEYAKCPLLPSHVTLLMMEPMGNRSCEGLARSQVQSRSRQENGGAGVHLEEYHPEISQPPRAPFSSTSDLPRVHPFHYIRPSSVHSCSMAFLYPTVPRALPVDGQHRSLATWLKTRTNLS